MLLWSLPFGVGRWKIQWNYYIISGGTGWHGGIQSRVCGLGVVGNEDYCFTCGEENSGGYRGKGLDAKCLALAYVEY